MEGAVTSERSDVGKFLLASIAIRSMLYFAWTPQRRLFIEAEKLKLIRNLTFNPPLPLQRLVR
jgi:hypothetical protein